MLYVLYICKYRYIPLYIKSNINYSPWRKKEKKTGEKAERGIRIEIGKW
jgi:hypothetical protein